MTDPQPLPPMTPEPTTPTSLLLNLLTQLNVLQGQVDILIKDREQAAEERREVNRTVKVIDTRLQLHDLTAENHKWMLEKVRRWAQVEERAKGGWFVLTLLWTIAVFAAGVVMAKMWLVVSGWWRGG